MARPNVTVIVDDQSYVIPATESGSVTRGGMASFNGLILALGNTAERKNGTMEVNSVGDWIQKLNSPDPMESTIYNVAGTKYGSDSPNFGGGTAARWPLGPTGNWKNEWWSAHNYLQYGGLLIIGGTGSDINTTMSTSSTPLHNKQTDLDVVFAGVGDGSAGSTANQIAAANSIAQDRLDVVAVFPDLSMGGEDGTTISTDATIPTSVTQNEFSIVAYGTKHHLDIGRGTDLNTNTLVKTNVSADVAGCIARNDRLGDPWTSPAGFEHGQILDVIRLTKNPTDAEQDTLYDAKINPVVTFPGEGTVLFGDKTCKAATSTLSRINVSRLFIYLKKTIGQAARSLLFKQNDEITRAQFVNAVTPILNRVKATRGISDFRVVCDETNNLPGLVDANQFIADVFIKPTTSINYIHLTFTNKNSDADLG